jgi:CheY-like chemotaxis protein
LNESVSQIYVVDDDLSVREGVGRLIRSAGLNVKTFPTAQEPVASLGSLVYFEFGVSVGPSSGARATSLFDIVFISAQSIIFSYDSWKSH